MTSRSVGELVPGYCDFGPIPPKEEQLSGVYTGLNTVMTKLWSGHLFFANTNDMITAPHLINIGINEPHMTRTLMSLVRPGNVVVDVGANVGYFSVLGAWRSHPGGQVWAFEPIPSIYRLLSDNLFVSGYKGAARLHRAALSDRRGTAQLRVFPGYEATSSIRPISDDYIRHTAAETGRESHLVEVDLVTLDEVMADVPEIDVMKIDAEGHEPEIIRGAVKIIERSKGLKILMEFVPHTMGEQGTRDHVALLRALGFAFHLIRDDGSIQADLEDRELFAASFMDLLLIR